MKQEEFFSRKRNVILCCFIACTLWGSAFPCIKTGYRIFDIAGGDFASQILFAGIRFFIAGVMVIIFGSIMQKKPLVPSKDAAGRVLVLSLLQTSLQYALFYIGLSMTSAVNGSIISGSSGFFTMIFAALILSSERMTVKKTAGCILGFAGIAVMNLSADFTLAFNGAGDILLLFSSVSSAFSSLVMKVYSKKDNPVMLSGWQFAAGGLMLTVLGAGAGGSLNVPGGASLLLILYMAFISSAAYTLWSVILKYNDVSQIAVFKFIIPVMGVFLSRLIVPGTVISGGNIAALVMVSAGIFTANYTRSAKRNQIT